MSTKMIIWIVVAVIVVAAVVVFLAMPKVQAPASSTGPAAATSSGTLGGQIYENVAPQAAVPQNLPQVNPFGQ